MAVTIAAEYVLPADEYVQTAGSVDGRQPPDRVDEVVAGEGVVAAAVVAKVEDQPGWCGVPQMRDQLFRGLFEAVVPAEVRVRRVESGERGVGERLVGAAHPERGVR